MTAPNLTGLRVRTANVLYTGPLRLDISRQGDDPIGSAFAPSWGILRPAITQRQAADQLLKAAEGKLLDDGRDEERRLSMRAEAERIELAAWDVYAPRYLAEMRRVYRERPDVWRHLEGIAELKRGSMHPPEELGLVLVCFCSAPWAAAVRHCHRFLLAERVLVPCGAVYEGEIELSKKGAPR